MLKFLQLNIRRVFQSVIILASILRIIFTMIMQLIFVLFLSIVISLSQNTVDLLVSLFGLQGKE
jgi:hypothetical protein